MAKGTFFLSWELWEEMTFVLAMGIVVVFCVGLSKLWLDTRQMRELERIDTEKQARLAQMRKSGLSATGRPRAPGHDIPFGVKALESGVEVEGIWIARMASMASRPPDRKWSSRRKARPPPIALPETTTTTTTTGEMGGMGGAASGAGLGTAISTAGSRRSARRGSRGSRRSNKISRREIVEPSVQTREKLEDMSLLEEELQAGYGPGSGGKRQSTGEGVAGGQENRLSGHFSALGRIHRGLKKVTSSETWREQARKQRQEGKRLDAKQFHEGAQAKKPQRFYPVPDVLETSPAIVATQPLKGHAGRSQVNSLISANRATRVDASHNQPQQPVRVRQPQQAPVSTNSNSHVKQKHTSRLLSSTSLRLLRNDGPEHSTLSQTQAQAARPTHQEVEPQSQNPTFSVPRRSSSMTRNTGRRSSSGSRDRAGSATRGEPLSAPPPQRYPPNSSRSGPVVQSQHTSQQQQKHRSPSISPSPTAGSSDAFVNTQRRKVNSDFEVLPAGTFALAEPSQQYRPVKTSEPASSAASTRSSLRSRSSDGRNRLQKRRKSESS